MLRSLLIFSEVANRQSFTLAAEQFGMSKSAISQQIKRLEEHIGQQLLSRNTRGMSLTAAGEKLLPRCERLQDQVNMAFEELSTNKETPSGTFSLSIPHSCEKNILVPVLSQLCLEFPKIKPRIIITDSTKDLIQENLDVAIYAGALKDSNYRALPIGTVSEIFCATPQYLKKYGPIESLNELSKHRWISAPGQDSHLIAYSNDDEITFSVTSFADTNTLPTALEMVLHGMGVSLLPEFIVQQALSQGRLVQILPKYQGHQLPFYLVHRFYSEKPIHITRFHQLVKHFFAKAKLGITC